MKSSVNSYVPIHCHYSDSLLDGLSDIKELVLKAKEFGMPGLSKTDHGRVGLVNDFYRLCKENDINPIIGCEFYVAHGNYEDKSPENKEMWHITVIAKNNIGLVNLYHLSYLMNKNGFYYKPRIDDDLLFKYKEGLICLSGCAGSEINSHLRDDEGYEYNFDKAVEVAKKFKKEFGDDYYLELQDHPMRSTGKMWPVQDKINKNLTKISKLLGIKRVLTADCHYVNPEDEEAHEVLLCIGTGHYLSETDRMSLSEFDLSLKDPKVLKERWKDDLEPIENTFEINNKVHIEFNLEEQIPPEFPTPEGFSHKQYLKLLTYRGAYKRFYKYTTFKTKNLSPTIEECIEELLTIENLKFHNKEFSGEDIISRIEMELATVNKLELNTYFLVVQEYINWANDNGILTGPGRGSSCGSLVCYCLNITRINPLGDDGLMFERFINPDRISMADIDSDFEARGRQKVIQHLKDLYGEEHVAGIGVQSTLRSKNAVRDVARVLEYPFADSLALTKLLPDAEHTGAPKLHEYIMSDEELKKLYNDPEKTCETPEFRERYLHEPEVKKIVDLAIKLEGKQRNHGVHACATIIGAKPIWYFFPTEISNDVMATTVPMHDVEEGGVNGGLWKMDILGLSTLDLISDTIGFIKQTKDEDINIDEIDLEDYETLQSLREGRCKDIFTFSSPGMQNALKGLQVKEFSDLVLVNAMYRPGAMDYIDDAIKVKNGEKEPVYYLKDSEQFLKSTYGIIAYQEQGMRIAQMIGFTGGETDNMRKALAKKNKAFLDNIFPTFKEKAIAYGNTEESVNKYWESLIGFSRYSFNYAHSLAYAVVGYQTAWLRTHYPVEYYAAYFNHVSGDKEKLGRAIKHAALMGIKVLPPSLNHSQSGFAPDKDGNIYYGFSAIKGIGKTGDLLVERRQNRIIKTVKNFFDIYSDISSSKMKALAESGVFDEVLKTDPQIHKRYILLYNWDDIYKTYKPGKISKKQTSLFDMTPQLIIVEPPNKVELFLKSLFREKELLGDFVSASPLEFAKMKTDKEAFKLIHNPELLENKKIKTVIVGIVQSIRKIRTKKGEMMAFVSLECEDGEFECTIFPKLLSESSWLREGKVIGIEGTLSKYKDDRYSLVADKIVEQLK